MKKSTYHTCGYQWPTGENGSHQCSIELLSKIESMAKALRKKAEERRKKSVTFKSKYASGVADGMASAYDDCADELEMIGVIL